jgi:LuxR family maltose regulon positive regulatory protein
MCYRARLALAQSQTDQALQLMHEAEALVVKHQLPERYGVIVRTHQIATWLSTGMLEVALRWGEEFSRRNPLEQILAQPPAYLQEDYYVALGRVWLAEGKAEQALQLFTHVRRTAEDAQRTGDALYLMPLQALAYRALGDARAAREMLTAALGQTAAENYVRIYVDEGESMRHLLLATRQEMVRHPTPDGRVSNLEYVNRVLGSFDAPVPPGPTRVSTPAGEAAPVETLTEREREILRYIAAGKTNTEIARELVVETSTIKKHINHLFSKLGAHSRTQALARAAQLGWLKPD